MGSCLKRVTPFAPLFILASFAVAEPLHLKTGVIDPVRLRLELPASQVIPTSSPKVFHIVQLKSAITESDRLHFDAMGLEPVAFLPVNSFVIRLDEQDRINLANWDRLAWLGAMDPSFKVSPELGRRLLFSRDRIAQAALGVRQMTVTLFDGEDPGQAAQHAADVGLQVLEINEMGPRWGMLVQGAPSAASLLARSDSVAFIEEAADFTLRNDRTTWVIQSNQTNVTPVWDNGLHGENMIVGVLDSRVNMNHDMFRDPVNNTPGPNHRKVVAYFTSLGAGSHGTHVAGTIAGDRLPTQNTTFRNGMAYKARLTYGAIPSSSGLYTALMQAYNAGARDHANSWGDDGTTSYTQWCQAIDQYSWDKEDAMVVFASTNLSTLKTPENAKNVLAVGNTSQTPNQGNASSGGTGPTNDGRRKPEIWAPGSGIMSASSSNNTGFTSMSGTSMACPAITGAAALVRQYYTEGWNFGTPFMRNARRPLKPSGALIRATLMNGGVDMTGLNGYPGVREGWGRLLLDNALAFQFDARKTLAFDLRNAQGLTTGQETLYRFRVTSSAEQLKITMTFTDWPAAVMASSAPVNNVDLEVVAPDGTVYRGNNINTANGLSLPGGSADTINTTEMVILNSPATGDWTVRVKAPVVNMGGKQGHAVVVTGSAHPL